MGRGISTIVVACLWLTAAAAEAATRYASPTGTGPASSCPQADPCSLTNAVENPSVNASDEIVLAPGTYNETNPLVIDDDVYVHGTQTLPPETSVTSTAVQGIVLDSPGATLANLTLDQTGGTDALLIRQGYAERVGVYTSGNFACTLTGSAPDVAVLRDSICFASGSSAAAAVQVSGFAPTYGTVLNVTARGTGAANGAVAFGTSGPIQLTMKNTIARGGPSSTDVMASDGNGSTTVQVLASNSNYGTEAEVSSGGNASVTDPGTNGNQTAPPTLAPFTTFPQLAGSPTIDGGAFDPLLGQFDFTGQPRVEGSAPDIGADEADGTAPTVSIDSGPSGPTRDATPTFEFSASETVGFECRIGVGPFGSCSGPGNSHTPAALPDGSYTVEVRGTDGFNSSIATRSFSVDTTAPSTSIDRGPPRRTHKKRAVFRFSASESGARFECQVDRGAYRSCASPFRLRNVGRGRHVFAVRATDDLGNAEATPATHRWRRTRR